jgi:acetyltransferase
MGGKSVEAGIEILEKGNIATFDYPDSAANTFGRLVYYHTLVQNQKKIHLSKWSVKKSLKAEQLLQKVLKEKREILTEDESKEFLSYYHIPVVHTYIAKTKKEAVAFAKKIKGKVVLKLHSHSITHKSDVGGVKLNLETPKEIEQAFDAIKESVTKKVGQRHFQGVSVQKMIKLEGYELILGASYDPQLGPIVLFGSCGKLVEIFKDSALLLPPFSKFGAKHLIEKTKIYEALKGTRGERGINLDRLATILSHFSQMLVLHPRIKEVDINPILASSKELISLDARIVLHELKTKDEDLQDAPLKT